MSTSPEFLHPLALFHKRVTYSNAFHTDLMVSTSNGAFLHSYSKYPHILMDNKMELLENGKGLIVASVKTEKSNVPIYSEVNERVEEEIDTLYMSLCLDSLGWRKVFIDTRRVSPAVLDLSWKSTYENFCGIQGELKKKSIYSEGANIIESRDLCKLLSSNSGSLYTLYPFGHPLTSAFAGNIICSALTWQSRASAHFISKYFAKDMKSFVEHLERREI